MADANKRASNFFNRARAARNANDEGRYWYSRGCADAAVGFDDTSTRFLLHAKDYRQGHADETAR